MFGDLEDVNIFTQNVHTLDGVVEDIVQNGDISLVDASAFEKRVLNVKTFIRMMTMQKKRRVENTVWVVMFAFSEADKAFFTTNENRMSRMSRDGTEWVYQEVIDDNRKILDHLTRDGRKKALQAYIFEAIIDANSETDIDPVPHDA